MKRVLFIQHGPLDEPGLLAEEALASGTAFEIVQPWRGEPLPDRLEGIAGLALGGGAQSAYQEAEYPYLKQEKTLLREARVQGIPTMGLCLGAQLMASAFGADVKPNLAKEIGFYPLAFDVAAASDALWCGVPAIVPAHWHGDTFDLPAGATRLASSALTPNQLFVCDKRHYALQFHLEMDVPIFDAMVADDLAELREMGIDPEALELAAREHFPAIEGTARSIFRRWFALLG